MTWIASWDHRRGSITKAGSRWPQAHRRCVDSHQGRHLRVRSVSVVRDARARAYAVDTRARRCAGGVDRPAAARQRRRAHARGCLRMIRVVVLAWGREPRRRRAGAAVSRGHRGDRPLWRGRRHFVCGGLSCCLFAGWPDVSGCSVRACRRRRAGTGHVRLGQATRESGRVPHQMASRCTGAIRHCLATRRAQS